MGHTTRRYRITVTTRASRNKVEPTSDANGPGFHVWVTAVPERGKANSAVLTLLADYFQVPSSRLHIISGHGSRTKRIEIVYQVDDAQPATP